MSLRTNNPGTALTRLKRSNTSKKMMDSMTEVFKCFDSILAFCLNRPILLSASPEESPENVQGLVAFSWETQPLSWTDWVEGDLEFRGSTLQFHDDPNSSECIPSLGVWRFVKQPHLSKLHIEGKWNSYCSCLHGPMPQGFLLFGECLALYSSMVLPTVLVPLTLDWTAQ